MNPFLSEFKNYLANKKKIADNTVSAYLNDLMHFEAYLETTYGKNLMGATKSMILTYMLDMQKQSKNAATVSRNLSSIKSFYHFHVDKGSLVKNPAVSIQGPKVEKKVPVFLSVEEVEKLLNLPDLETVKGIRDKAMLELMYATGIKVSELLNLKVEDYHKTMETILVQKIGNERMIPLGKWSKRYLDDYLEMGRPKIRKDQDNESFMFLNLSGKQMSRQGFWKLMRHYAQSGGIKKKLTPQIIRNSFVIHLMQNGADMATLQSLFGQSNITAMHMYLKTLENRTFEIYRKSHPRA